MNISLSTELHALVTGLVASGRFSSASEVIRAGLRLLERQEQDQLRRSAPPVSRGVGRHAG